MKVTGLARRSVVTALPKGDEVESLAGVPQAPLPIDTAARLQAREREAQRAWRQVRLSDEVLVRQRALTEKGKENTERRGREVTSRKEDHGTRVPQPNSSNREDDRYPINLLNAANGRT